MFSKTHQTTEKQQAMPHARPFFSTPVQAKLKVNEPNDKYEQEADAVADHVMRKPDAAIHSQPFQKVSISNLQRKCTTCEHEEEKVQRKENAIPIIQKKAEVFIQRQKSKVEPYIKKITVHLTPKQSADLEWAGMPPTDAVGEDKFTVSTGKGYSDTNDSAGTCSRNCCTNAETQCDSPFDQPNKIGACCTYVGDNFYTGKADKEVNGWHWWTRIEPYYSRRGIALHQHTEVTGEPIGHGCVRMEEDNAKRIYDFSVNGKTKVTIEGRASPVKCDDERICTLKSIKKPEELQNIPSEENQKVQNKYSPFSEVARKCMDCEHEEKKVQRKGYSGNVTVPPIVSEVISGSGKPLDKETKQFMERRMGHDFGNVQIHTDSKAAESASAINALAYTSGNHIVFNHGQYSPDSDRGKRLLAHELVHVGQQGKSKAYQENSNQKEGIIASESKQKEVSDKYPKISDKLSTIPNTAQNQLIAEKNIGKNEIDNNTDISNEAGHTPVIETAPKDPLLDPAFQSVISSTKKSANAQKQHDKPTKKIAEARLGAAPPVNEMASKAQKIQVDKMSEQPKGKFDKEGFKKILKNKIEGAMPKNEDQAKNYKENNKLDSIKNDLKQDVGKEKEAAAEPIEQTTKETPDKSKAISEPHKEMKAEVSGKTPVVANTENAAPKQKTDEEVSMEKEATSLDEQMATSDVSEEQLQNSNEPKFITALDTKKESQASARKAPDDYRAEENPMLEKAKISAEQQIAGQMLTIHGTREHTFEKVDIGKNDAKSKNEHKRKEVANQLEGIYHKTKIDVETKLSDLEKNVIDKFDEKTKQANLEFETEFGRRASDYKDGIWNSIRNFVAGVPKEVENIFHQEKDKFMAKMDKALDEIASMVDTGLNDAVQRISEGRKSIADAVQKLEPGLQDIGKEITEQLSAKFDALEQKVDEKQEQLADSLAKKYVEQVDKMSERLEKIKAEQKGVIGRAKDAIMAVINTILGLKKMLEELFAKAVKVVGDIVKNPGGFFDNLGAAVKLGFNNFTDNILTHLKTGFFTWLMGNIPPGIEFPKTWDLMGIFSFVAQILGLTWANIRQRVVKKVGEPVMKALETVFDIFKIIITKGIGGLWDYIKEKIGDLKIMVIDAIMDYLQSAVIKAGISFIIGMLNPVGAFIKICMAIYNVVKFIIEKGKQIMEFVNSILDSVAEIVAGKIGPAAKRVEDSLAKAIPITIGFLASVLGITGLTEKVQAIIHKIQAPINKAIDWVVDKAIGFAEKLGLDKLVAKVGQGMTNAKDWAKTKIKSGKKKVKEVGKKILGFFGVKSTFEDEKGESHSVAYEEINNQPVMIVRSTPKTILKFLEFYKVEYKAQSQEKTKKEHLDKIEDLVEKMNLKIKDLSKRNNPNKDKKDLLDIKKDLLDIKADVAHKLGLLMKGNKKIGKSFESYYLEGLVGRYSKIANSTGDDLEGDHQPQTALLEWSKKYLRKDTIENWLGSGHGKNAYAILLHKRRHKLGATHSTFSKPDETEINAEIDITKRREKVVKVLQNALNNDADEMLKVYEKSRNNLETWGDIWNDTGGTDVEKSCLISKIKVNVKAGEDSMKQQPLDSLIK